MLKSDDDYYKLIISNTSGNRQSNDCTNSIEYDHITEVIDSYDDIKEYCITNDHLK